MVVFAPLVAPFGPQALRGVWLVLNLASLGLLCGVVIRLWAKDWPFWLQVSFCLAVIASKPVRGGIALGQFHLIPTALMLATVLALHEARRLAAGIMLGVALAKPTMALPFLGYLVARRQWQAIGVAVGFHALALAVVAIWLGMGPIRLLDEWVTTARLQLSEGAIDLPSLILKAWPAAPVSPPQVTLAVLAVGFAVTLRAWWKPEPALVSFCTFVAAIFTYHRPYDLVLLIPTLAYLIETARVSEGRSQNFRLAAAVGFAVLLIAPSHPSVAGRWEVWHGSVFVVVAYLYLGLLAYDLATGRGGTRPIALAGQRA
jgi:hypothetical protein